MYTVTGRDVSKPYTPKHSMVSLETQEYNVNLFLFYTHTDSSSLHVASVGVDNDVKKR